MCDLIDVFKDAWKEEFRKEVREEVRKEVREEGLRNTIEIMLETGCDDATIITKVSEKFKISQTSVLERLNSIKAAMPIL